MLGVKRDGVFFSRLLSGRNTPGKYGKGLPAMKRRIPSGIRFDKAGGMARHGRDAIRADDGLLGLTGSEGRVGGAGKRTTPGRCTGAARQPARFVAISGRRGRKAILSDKRSVMLRLGDAPAGKADAVPDFQQGLPRSSIRQGRCRSRAAGLSPRGERSRMSGRPQAAKKPSMRRALSFPMGGQASGTVFGRAHGHVCNRACMPYCLKKGLMGARFGRKGLSSHAGEAPSVDARFVCGRSQAWAEAAAVSSSLRAALRRQASLRSRSSRATMVKRLMKARANCR